MPDRDSAKSRLPTLYFDGACPVCAREVAMYRNERGSDGVRWVDVASCDPVALGPGLTRDAALARLHWRQPDGHLLSGAAAFTRLWLSLPRWFWLGRVFRFPVALSLLEAGYRAFLTVRPLWRRRGKSG